jgi:hypothetical protein
MCGSFGMLNDIEKEIYKTAEIIDNTNFAFTSIVNSANNLTRKKYNITESNTQKRDFHNASYNCQLYRTYKVVYIPIFMYNTFLEFKVKRLESQITNITVG